MRTRTVLALAALALGACGPSETPQQKAAARVAKAEAALEACKQAQGMAGTPTPTTPVLDDPATRGRELTPDLANQLRLKIVCRTQLDELLAARRDAAETK